MDAEQFRLLLEKAVSGNNSAIEKILKLYTPLIKGASYIKGKIDKDLHQYILLHIIKKISKFKV